MVELLRLFHPTPHNYMKGSAALIIRSTLVLKKQGSMFRTIFLALPLHGWNTTNFFTRIIYVNTKSRSDLTLSGTNISISMELDRWLCFGIAQVLRSAEEHKYHHSMWSTTSAMQSIYYCLNYTKFDILYSSMQGLAIKTSAL